MTETSVFRLADLATVLPELVVLTMTCVVLVVGLYVSEQRRVMVYALSLLTLGLALLATLGPHGAPDQGAVTAFNATFVRDGMGDLLKAFVYIVTAAVFVYSREYLDQRGLFQSEFYVLGLFGMLGMMLLISAGSLITVYLGLELLALCSYALVGLQRDSTDASEAAMKYFVLGAISSGMLLYGMSMLYGATGSLNLEAIGSAVSEGAGPDVVMSFGLAFIVVGLAFKLGAVPFHMWLPDVYQGAPTAVTVYIGAAPKLAAFAMAYRVLEGALGDLHGDWQAMLVVLAVLSLALGNLVAIAQSNIKRMLAYSTISHIGFLLLGLVAGTPDGYAAAMFYAISYAIMAAGAFGMIILLSRAGFEAEQLTDFKGLNQRSPWFAAMMLLLMASLAGVPPGVLGLYAKILVLKAAVSAGMPWLAGVGVLFAVIGAFYYLRVIKLMYLDEPDTDEPLEAPADLRTVLSINGLAQLVLGVLAGPLVAACTAALAGGV